MSKGKKRTDGIVAVFQYLDDLCHAMDKVKHRTDFHDHVVYSHTSYHELMERAEERYGSSEVKWFTLTGALTGIFTGFAMPLGLDYLWPIVVGGKTAGIYSVPAYFVFGFELMVLFGALATILGMLVMGRLPNPKDRVLDVRLTDDHFAIFVPGATPDSEQAKLLKDFGAKEIFSTN